MWHWTENQIELVMIRHGVTPSNREQRYLGRTDESLTIESIKALQNMKSIASYPKIDYLFSSPMKRCIETAQILYSDKEPIMIQEWREIDFGDFEGKCYLELKENKDYQEWIDSGGQLPFPNGESRKAFISRCKRGFYKMLKELSAINDRKHKLVIGLIVHGGTIMSLLSCYAGGNYFEYQVINGNGYRCRMRYSPYKIWFEALEKLE